MSQLALVGIGLLCILVFGVILLVHLWDRVEDIRRRLDALKRELGELDHDLRG